MFIAARFFPHLSNKTNQKTRDIPLNQSLCLALNEVELLWVRSDMSSSQDQLELKLFHGDTPEAYLQQYSGWYQRTRIDRINKFVSRKIPKPSLPNNSQRISHLKEDIEVAKKDLDTQRIYNDYTQLGEEYLKNETSFEDALQVFRTSLNYAKTDEEKFKSNFNIIRTCLFQQDWERAQHLTEELQLQPVSEEQQSLITSQLICVTAFCLLSEKSYLQILRLLEHVTPTLGSSFNEVLIHPNFRLQFSCLVFHPKGFGMCCIARYPRYESGGF